MLGGQDDLKQEMASSGILLQVFLLGPEASEHLLFVLSGMDVAADLRVQEAHTSAQ